VISNPEVDRNFETAEYFIQQAAGCGLPAMGEIAGDDQKCSVVETGIDVDNCRGQALRGIDTVKQSAGQQDMGGGQMGRAWHCLRNCESATDSVAGGGRRV